MRRGLALLAALMLVVGGIVYFSRHSGPADSKNPGSPESFSTGSSNGASPSAQPSVALSTSGVQPAMPLPATPPLSSPPVPLIPGGSPANYLSPAGTPGVLQITNIPPYAVVDAMRVTMHNYASMFGQNPVGNNQEITAALNGKNPRQANFINADSGMRINSNGELIDPWGTPYFFHALSSHEMEIHSAGPDKTMWTQDDIVTR